jgi:5-methylcytosine-specific restriction endonuclease McrA
MPRKYTKEYLEPIVQESSTMRQVLQKIGLKLTGGSYRLLQIRIREYKISTDHFKGSGWAKGLTAENSSLIKRNVEKRIIPDSEIFKENSGITHVKLRRRLFQLGWINKCSICGLMNWLEKPITCHVDHINGINGDNRIENLRMLCPNCHQQTDTWGNKTPV